MLGLRMRTVAVAAVLMLATVGGCYWLRYGEIARTHAELLERLAIDARDAVAAGHRLSNSDIETLRYPLERAEDFVRISDDDPPPESLVALRETAASYREFVDLLDRLRVNEVAEPDKARVDALARRISDAAGRTRAALQNE